MRYSVIVLTFGDRLPALRRCLAKIHQGVRTPVNAYEVIVVNNGSTEIRRWAEQPIGDVPANMILSVPTNEGVCARNYGLRVARGEFIIQVDDDVLVAPGFDNVLLHPMEDSQYSPGHSIGATGPHGFYQDSTWGLLIDDRRRPSPGQFCDLVMGYCWAWRNVQEDAGLESADRERARFLYDTQFNPFWHEESDLQLQIRAGGAHIVCTPPVASHQSLHDWAETKRDGPITGVTIAEANFYKLRDKWRDKDVRFEGPLVGLQGPAPGRRAER